MSEEVEVKKTKYTGSRKARAGNRRRTKRWREKQLENEFSCEDQQTFNELRARKGLICFGETSAHTNCVTIHEEIQVAGEFSAAMGCRTIIPGETPRCYITSIFRSWEDRGCPAFDRKNKKFSFLLFDTPDIRKYVWPPGADDPYKPGGEE